MGERPYLLFGMAGVMAIDALLSGTIQNFGEIESHLFKIRQQDRSPGHNPILTTS